MASRNGRDFGISADAGKGVAARREIAVLRGTMADAAERRPIPDRFVAVEHAHRPAMVIHDTATGRQAIVGLHAYGEVRKLLGNLFGPPRPSPAERLGDMGLPARAEHGEFVAVAFPNPHDDEALSYRLEIEGVTVGELGIGRIDVRDDGTTFHVIGPDGHVAAADTLDGAMEAAADEIGPLYGIGGPRP